MKLKFYFKSEVWADQVIVYLVGEDAHNKRFIAKPMDLVFEPLDNNSVNTSPTLAVSGFMAREFLPALANGLAEAGYRHESTDAGELKATKYHLEDLRHFLRKEHG